LKALSQDGAFFVLTGGKKNLAEWGFDGKLCGIY
jgi:hypothetical protein